MAWKAGASLKSSDSGLNDISLEYSYSQLLEATGSFDRKCQIGHGSCGGVFRGIQKDGTEVAIKVLDMPEETGFEEEVKVLSKFRHPNLVILMGFARQESRRFLVYELLAGGDVYKRLQKCSTENLSFTWRQRVSAAFDASCGLSHLHHATPKVFHRDIKCPNILLDRNGTAKMADFGLACLSHGSAHKVKQASGTVGYACPFYVQRGIVTQGSEVYSFGIVLLEILTASPPAYKMQGPDGSLQYQFLAAHINGDMCIAASMADPRAQWPQQVVASLVELALRCTSLTEDLRPGFAEIVTSLRVLRDIQEAGHSRQTSNAASVVTQPISPAAQVVPMQFSAGRDMVVAPGGPVVGGPGPQVVMAPAAQMVMGVGGQVVAAAAAGAPQLQQPQQLVPRFAAEMVVQQAEQVMCQQPYHPPPPQIRELGAAVSPTALAAASAAPWSTTQAFRLCAEGEEDRFAGSPKNMGRNGVITDFFLVARPDLEGDGSVTATKARLLDTNVVSSVSSAVDHLNKGGLVCQEGLCVVFSSSMKAYFLLCRQDMKEVVKARFGKLEERALAIALARQQQRDETHSDQQFAKLVGQLQGSVAEGQSVARPGSSRHHQKPQPQEEQKAQFMNGQSPRAPNDFMAPKEQKAQFMNGPLMKVVQKNDEVAWQFTRERDQQRAATDTTSKPDDSDFTPPKEQKAQFMNGPLMKGVQKNEEVAWQSTREGDQQRAAMDTTFKPDDNDLMAPKGHGGFSRQTSGDSTVEEQKAQLMNGPLMKGVQKNNEVTWQFTCERDQQRAATDTTFKPDDNVFTAPKAPPAAILWTLECTYSAGVSLRRLTREQRSVVHRQEPGECLSCTLRVGTLFQEEFFDAVVGAGEEYQPFLSREHFQIWAEEMPGPDPEDLGRAGSISCYFFLTNFGACGTVVNGTHLRAPGEQVPLHSGDTIGLPRLLPNVETVRLTSFLQFTFDLTGSILRDADVKNAAGGEAEPVPSILAMPSGALSPTVIEPARTQPLPTQPHLRGETGEARAPEPMRLSEPPKPIAASDAGCLSTSFVGVDMSPLFVLQVGGPAVRDDASIEIRRIVHGAPLGVDGELRPCPPLLLGRAQQSGFWQRVLVDEAYNSLSRQHLLIEASREEPPPGEPPAFWVRNLSDLNPIRIGPNLEDGVEALPALERDERRRLTHGDTVVLNPSKDHMLWLVFMHLSALKLAVTTPTAGGGEKQPHLTPTAGAGRRGEEAGAAPSPTAEARNSSASMGVAFNGIT